jgi:hypothetical protein
LALVWDNASWHLSQIVHTWVHEHNRFVKHSGKGIRLLVCFLPVKSLWLNPIEPKWVHGKRRIVEPFQPPFLDKAWLKGFAPPSTANILIISLSPKMSLDYALGSTYHELVNFLSIIQ